MTAELLSPRPVERHLRGRSHPRRRFLDLAGAPAAQEPEGRPAGDDRHAPPAPRRPRRSRPSGNQATGQSIPPLGMMRAGSTSPGSEAMNWSQSLILNPATRSAGRTGLGPATFAMTEPG